MHRPILTLLACTLLAVPSLPALAATEATETPKVDYVRAHYTKHEYRIPMRDGARLFTAVYVPKDQGKAWPILMSRTPYSVAPYGTDQYRERLGPSEEFDKAGYIFVFQDVRGRYMSEGTFVEMRPHLDQKSGPKDIDESTDTYDTIEFVLKHVPGHNGRVGQVGISYPGFFTAAGMIDSHPALKAASPQAPMIDLFKGDDTYHNGAYMLAANFLFYDHFKPFPIPQTPPKESVHFDMGTPDAYDFLLRIGPTSRLDQDCYKGANPYFADGLYHTTHDAYWQARNLAPHLRNIKCAVLIVGGWFDAEDLSGPFRAFHAIAAQNPGTPLHLAIGPWVHGGWARNDGDHLGDISFDAKTSEFFQKQVEFPFFEHYLRDQEADLPRAWMFETGTNVWRRQAEWPAARTRPRTLYFRRGGLLSFDPPAAGETPSTYVSDPAHPVPFTGYVTDTIPQRYMVDDQRFASRRPDVLTFQTEPLEQDVTLAGPVSPRLFVATTGTDADFVVKLIDVSPGDRADRYIAKGGKNQIDTPPVRLGGYEQLLRGEPFRAKFRRSWEKPEPMVPGQREEIAFAMPDVLHTFRRGHRIMVQVQSSWFPLVDRNPQTFTDIPHAKPEDFKPATQTVYHEAGAASGLEVLELPQP